MSVEKIVILPASEDYEKRMAQTRARAEWELGDSSWAGVIVGAFLNPDSDAITLTAEKAS